MGHAVSRGWQAGSRYVSVVKRTAQSAGLLLSRVLYSVSMRAAFIIIKHVDGLQLQYGHTTQ